MEEIVQTKCSRIKKDLSRNFVCVNYEPPIKKLKLQDKFTKEDNTVLKNKYQSNIKNQNDKDTKHRADKDIKQKQDQEMKKLRYEVMKFGASGFDAAKAKQEKIASAIRLGARPFRNKKLNYKELKEKRKTEREEANNSEVSGLSKSLVKHKSKQKKFTKKSKGGILEVYGKVQKEESLRNKKK